MVVVFSSNLISYCYVLCNNSATLVERASKRIILERTDSAQKINVLEWKCSLLTPAVCTGIIRLYRIKDSGPVIATHCKQLSIKNSHRVIASDLVHRRYSMPHPGGWVKHLHCAQVFASIVSTYMTKKMQDFKEIMSSSVYFSSCKSSSDA